MATLFVELDETSEWNPRYSVNGIETTKEEALFYFNHAVNRGVNSDIGHAGKIFVVTNIEYGFSHKTFTAVKKEEYLESIRIK